MAWTHDQKKVERDEAPTWVLCLELVLLGCALWMLLSVSLKPSSHGVEDGQKFYQTQVMGSGE